MQRPVLFRSRFSFYLVFHFKQNSFDGNFFLCTLIWTNSRLKTSLKIYNENGLDVMKTFFSVKPSQATSCKERPLALFNNLHQTSHASYMKFEETSRVVRRCSCHELKTIVLISRSEPVLRASRHFMRPFLQFILESRLC